HALGGEVSGRQVKVPGPGHSPTDRSLSVKLVASAPDGFVVHSFAGDDPIACKDYLRAKLGLPSWGRSRKKYDQWKPAPAKVVYDDHRLYTEQQRSKARWLWQRRTAAENSPVEKYLREMRRYAGPIPATIGFLQPLKPEHEPAMIAAFALADGTDAGVLSI